MQRGTTPTLSFSIPIDTSLLDAVWVTLSQNDTEIVTKTMSECELDGNIIRAKLTQADTLLLSTDYDTEIQLRVRTKDGTVPETKIFKERTERVLKPEVI